MSARHAAFVMAASTLRPVAQIPEIRLHLADDAFELWEVAEREAGQPDQPPPFWAFAWPGGQALARYVLDHPQVVAGRSVLDLGSGSGLTAIAAAVAGAAAVTASEVDSFAMAAIALNAEANGVRIAVTGDLLGDHPGQAGGPPQAGSGKAGEPPRADSGQLVDQGPDVVFAADIWYEKRLAERALSLLQRARARGADVLVGDVGRAYLPRQLMRELAAYEIPVDAELENVSVRRAAVLTLL